MIKGHEVFRLYEEGSSDTSKQIQLEVNWNQDPGVKDCKLIRVIYPKTKESFVIKRERLNAVLFALGKPDEQMDMIPQKISRKRRFEGVVRMKATKDIKKGEEIVTTCFHDLPDFEDEIIGKIPTDSFAHVPVIGK